MATEAIMPRIKDDVQMALSPGMGTGFGLSFVQQERLRNDGAREHERKLALEAAGLSLFQKYVQLPQQPLRRQSTRRLHPATPMLSSSLPVSAQKLPPVPEPDAATSDVFDRYEVYHGHHQN
ncbi:hypothetical protein K438DRAFT_1789825 [Mycena galopus ATCC 62051]|nr:hypothetical protein K438DRAFT_1789825 [Mycena galopus ATCC 62051]